VRQSATAPQQYKLSELLVLLHLAPRGCQFLQVPQKHKGIHHGMCYTSLVVCGASQPNRAPEQLSAHERNKALARRLKSAAPSPAAYQAFRAAAGSLMRGKGSARDAFNIFVLHYGNWTESMELFLEMAHLVPDEQLQAELCSLTGLMPPAPPPQGAQHAGSVDNSTSSAPAPPQPTGRAHVANAQYPGTWRSAGAQNSSLNGAQGVDGVPSDVRDAAEPAVRSSAGEPSTSSATADSQVTEQDLLDLGISDELLSGSSGARRAPRKLAKRTARLRGGAESSADREGRKNVLYWTRQDFRLHDNPALHKAAQAAARRGGRVYVAFVYSPGASP
jgi:DNA photolyase